MSPSKIKILLLSVNSYSFFYDQLVVPFGLISLASYIDDGSYEFKGIEMNQPPEKILQRYLKIDKEFLKEIKEFSPDIIAMSTFASNIYNVLFWADVFKTVLPDCIIVIGGNHASYIPNECLKKSKGLDMVVRFEGEIPFKMICEQIKNKKYDFSKIPNLTYRENGTIRENPQIDLIKDLGELPMLNRDNFKENIKKAEDIVHADMITARGCPFNCTFCNCNHYWNKIYRVRLIESVIQELKSLIKVYSNLESVRFRDESITINKHRCKMLCEAIKENGISLNFQAHSRLDGLDEDVIKSLSETGFKLLFIGLESGSKDVLNRLKKGIKIERAKGVIKLLRKYGIRFRISFMTETPNEKFKDTFKTIKLIKNLKLRKDEYYVGSGIAIYPGTTEYDRFLKLNPDYNWITKKYKFTGKYYPFIDSMGNIIHPDYIEHSLIKRLLIRVFIYLNINPRNLFGYIKEGLASMIKKFKAR